MQDLYNVIRNRKSCRTYAEGSISSEKKQAIEEYISQNSTGVINNESFDFIWIARNYKTDTPMKLNYGTIVNHSNYILGKAPFNTDSYINYGYALEKILLKAAELGLGTCWIGYFDQVYFPEIKRNKGEYIPSLIIVGNAAPKKKVSEKITRYFVKADARKPWNELFFSGDFTKPLSKEEAGKYATVIEMLRLAPSSGNTQPWRIVKETDKYTFHFYRKTVHAIYQKRKLHDVDVGICMAHFELSAIHEHLGGNWQKLENPDIKTEADTEYILSWSGE